MVAKRKKNNKQQVLCRLCDQLFTVQYVGKKGQERNICKKCDYKITIKGMMVN